MESLNTYLRVEARKSYEQALSRIPSLIRNHDLCKSAGELFVSRGYMRKYKVIRSSYAPTVVLSLEPKAELSRVVAFFCEEFEEKHGLQDYYVSQSVESDGLSLRYEKKKYSYRAEFSLYFKLHNIKTCTIIETKVPYTSEHIERTIVC